MKNNIVFLQYLFLSKYVVMFNFKDPEKQYQSVIVLSSHFLGLMMI